MAHRPVWRRRRFDDKIRRAPLERLAPVMDDLLSRLQALLGAEYRVLEELGRGGMSRVFLAEEVSVERKVVVKVLPPDLSAEISADRFRREMAIMAQLTHPYIVPILRTSDAEPRGLLFYVMPYLAGDSVRTLITREVQLPVEQAREVAREVALALDFAHRRGVVHRDIKPENVLLVDGHAMVIDFGVARALSSASADRMTVTGLTVGTPNYMSPEQASGEREVDGRSDIYSLGCLLFEMLAGEIPHRAPTAQVTLARRLSEPAPDVTKLRATVPADLRDALKRALAPSPADRFRTAGDMAVALGATPSDPARATISSLTSQPPSRSAPVSRPRMYAAIAVGAAVLAAALWFGRGSFGGTVAASAPTSASASLRSATTEPIPIAVLPLENRGRAEDEWFGDGLTDELRGALSRHSGLLVKGTRSSNLFRGTTKPIAEIARELGVRYLVTGAVAWEPTDRGRGRVRVSPELIDVSNESTKWQQSFDTSLTDLFTGQRALGARVADALAESLVPSATRAAPFLASTVNADAYALYLSARRELERWTADALQRSADLLRRAIRADSSFARAYALLSFAISNDQTLTLRDPRFAEMLAASDRAARLSPDDPEVLTSRAFVRPFRHEFREALVDARRAVSLDSANSYALWGAANLEAAFGNYEESTRLGRRASQVDPLSAGDIFPIELLYAGRFDEARAALAAGLALDSMSTANGWQFYRASLAALRGDLAEFDVASSLSARLRRPVPSHYRAIALARAGRIAEAREALRNLPSTTPPALVAEVYTSLGMPDSAMSWLERAVAEGRYRTGIAVSEHLIPLRSDPRYQALLKRVGLR